MNPEKVRSMPKTQPSTPGNQTGSFLFILMLISF